MGWGRSEGERGQVEKGGRDNGGWGRRRGSGAKEREWQGVSEGIGEIEREMGAEGK